MKNIEIHLKKFLEINEACVNAIEPQVYMMTVKIREVRKKLNSVLDELEKRVTTERDRIYKEELFRTQDKNHQCLSLIHAVRNSHCMLEAVDKYGSNLQKFLMAEKMKSQLHSYCNLVVEKYEKTDIISVEVEFASPIQSILSLSLSELGNVVTRISSNTLPLTCSWKPTKDCQVKTVEVIDLKGPSDTRPMYTGVTFFPGDRMMLADFGQCILLNSSYQFITSHTLIGEPWNICVLDDQEVAVSLYDERKIQILSVVDDVIRPVSMITTKYDCEGIAAAGKGEMIVNGYCGNKKSYWSLISTNGDVKRTHQYDSRCYSTSYVALNIKKTRVYVSVDTLDSLVCFDMDGRKLFTYSPDNLRGPRGVAVDRYDNIYVLRNKPNTIHQLSPDGSVMRVVNTGVPKCPLAICIHKIKDMVIITNNTDRKKLHIYQLIYN